VVKSVDLLPRKHVTQQSHIIAVRNPAVEKQIHSSRVQGRYAREDYNLNTATAIACVNVFCVVREVSQSDCLTCKTCVSCCGYSCESDARNRIDTMCVSIDHEDNFERM